MTLITIRSKDNKTEEQIMHFMKIICDEQFDTYEIEVSGKSKTLKEFKND